MDSRSSSHSLQDSSSQQLQQERVTRTLFELIWQQELETVLRCSGRIQHDVNRGQELSNLTSVQEPSRESGSMLTDQFKLAVERQLNEKIKAENKIFRRQKIERWQKKKKEGQNFSSTIRYPARQRLARNRPRNKGQFVSRNAPPPPVSET
eukprot:g7954.t1